MSPWVCGITGCGDTFDTVETLIRHQATHHDGCECRVCGEHLPDGFIAIHHAFDEHTRAEYVRAYGADSDDIRLRERVKEAVEERVDVPSLLNQLSVDDEPAISASD